MADHSPAQVPAAGSAAGPESAPEALRPPPGHPRFPLFDSLRAFAAISILLVHAAIFSGAEDSWYWPLVAHLDVGVPFFFCLSGFLLYRPLLASRVLRAPGVRQRDYLRRRFLRIFPAYWLALTVLAVVPGLYGVFTENWWVYYFLLQNYPVYEVTPDCAQHVYECGIAPTWSLAVEVFFYAVLPFFALGMARLQGLSPLRGWLGLEIGVLAILAAISVWIQSSLSFSDLYSVLFFSPLGRAWWFGLGMGLAALSVRVQERGSEPPGVSWIGRNPTALWAAAAALYLATSLFWFEAGPIAGFRGESVHQYIAGYIIYGLIAALVMLPAVFGAERGGIPRRLLGNRVVGYLGLISYGIFLWHFPIVIALVQGGVGEWWPAMAFPVVALVTLAITIVCATLSYRLIERPLMRLK